MAGLVQAEHLEATRHCKEKDGWREEDASVVVGKAQGFEAGRGCHFGVGLTAFQRLGLCTLAKLRTGSYRAFSLLICNVACRRMASVSVAISNAIHERIVITRVALERYQTQEGLVSEVSRCVEVRACSFKLLAVLGSASLVRPSFQDITQHAIPGDLG